MDLVKRSILCLKHEVLLPYGLHGSLEQVHWSAGKTNLGWIGTWFLGKLWLYLLSPEKKAIYFTYKTSTKGGLISEIFHFVSNRQKKDANSLSWALSKRDSVQDIDLAPSFLEIWAKLKNFLRLSHLYYPVVSWKRLIDMWRIRIAFSFLLQTFPKILIWQLLI